MNSKPTKTLRKKVNRVAPQFISPQQRLESRLRAYHRTACREYPDYQPLLLDMMDQFRDFPLYLGKSLPPWMEELIERKMKGVLKS